MTGRTASVNSRKLLAMAVEHWPAKVLSIALAIILFVFHRMSALEDRFFSAPLQIELDGNLVPASSYPRMIRVSLRGEANSIYPILEDDIEVYLDMTRYTEEGTYRAPVLVRKKGTALGVEPLEISVDPLEVSLELDQKISKYVPLTPNLQGFPEPGYELVSYSLTPSQVAVEGPLRLMTALSELSTDSIELGGRSEDFTASVHILNRDPLLIIRGDGLVEFRGFIKKLIIIRGFENLPITPRGLAERFVIEGEVPEGSIRLQGEQGELESYLPQGRVLTLDCSQIDSPGLYALPVLADIPPAFTLIRMDPSFVTVQVDQAPGDDEGEGR
jgi:YbbR domain-containing protein